MVNHTYTYGHNLISQDQVDPATNTWHASFYAYDGRGTVRFLTNESGQVTDTYVYDAFGTMITVTGSTNNRYLYSGEQFDPNLGLYYLRARLMNPLTGRFWSMDSYAGSQTDPISLHKYLYANSDPTNLNDPTGYYSSGATEQMFVAKEVSNLAKAVIAAYVIGQIVESVFSHLDYINEQTGVREIEAAVAGASTSGITQSEFEALDRRIAGTAPRRRARSLYLHYSFEYHADSLVSQGLLAKPYGQATKTAYPTGWSAHYALALPQRDIQDSVYIVWPKALYEPTPPWGSRVAGITDDAGRVLPGGGKEWTFRFGSGGPGTVFGPISIPLGEPPPGVTQ